MSVEVLMPKLGLTMERGILIQWYKKEGETVREGDSIAEIETDKITKDIEAPASGVLLKILVAEEEEVKILTPLAVIGKPGEI